MRLFLSGIVNKSATYPFWVFDRNVSAHRPFFQLYLRARVVDERVTAAARLRATESYRRTKAT